MFKSIFGRVDIYTAMTSHLPGILLALKAHIPPTMYVELQTQSVASAKKLYEYVTANWQDHTDLGKAFVAALRAHHLGYLLIDSVSFPLITPEIEGVYRSKFSSQDVIERLNTSASAIIEELGVPSHMLKTGAHIYMYTSDNTNEEFMKRYRQVLRDHNLDFLLASYGTPEGYPLVASPVKLNN